MSELTWLPHNHSRAISGALWHNGGLTSMVAVLGCGDKAYTLDRRCIIVIKRED